jgi:D-amino peptidase
MPADPRITYHGRAIGYENGRLRWMPGLDQSVDGFLLPGHHAKEGTPGAFLPHTAWGKQVADFRINGRSVGEIGIEACFAGHWDVPFVLVQGDTAVCQETQETYPGVVTAEVKRAIGRDQCIGPEPAEGRRLTAEKITESIDLLRAGRLEPFKPRLPMTVTIEMRTIEQAEAMARRPGVRLLPPLTVETELERQGDVVKWFKGTGLDMPPEMG